MADQMLRPKLKLVETAPAEPNRPPALQSGGQMADAAARTGDLAFYSSHLCGDYRYATCFTASIKVGSLLSALELLTRLDTGHRCK